MKLYKNEYEYMLFDIKDSIPSRELDMIEQLIKAYFRMIEHMKTTSLYDVYKYQETLTEPMEMLVYDNRELKKEVNELREQLGLLRKYNIK